MEGEKKIMIIVSQDKEIINFDNVTRIFIEDFSEDGDGFGIGADTNSAESQCWDLGFYKTEERAKEVSEEIIQTRASCEEIKAIDDNYVKRRLISGLRCKYFDTYEMPAE